MRVRFLQQVNQHKPGDIVEVGDSIATKWIWRKIAVAVPTLETANLPPPVAEMAVTRTPFTRSTPRIQPPK